MAAAEMHSEGRFDPDAMTHQPETAAHRIGRKAVDLVGQQVKQRAIGAAEAIGGLKDLTERAMKGEAVSEDPTAGGKMLRGLSYIGSGAGPSAILPRRGR